MISVVIPSRNEKYLQKTILSLLSSAEQDIEILAILDGYWPPAKEIVDDKRVRYIHFSTPRGMRGGINAGVALAKGKYILKTDAHCKFSEGFDVELTKEHGEDWVAVPRRYRLDPEKWDIILDGRPPIDYMYLDKDLRGREWREKNLITSTLPKIDDLMTSQGSCWFMTKQYYERLDLLDEVSYGTFYSEFQEIGLKCWLSGGRVVINKNASYAHWHKDSKAGRGYTLSGDEREIANKQIKLWTDKGWYKQDRPLTWLFDKFPNIPTNE